MRTFAPLMDFSQSSLYSDLTVPGPHLRFPNCWLFLGLGRQSHDQPPTWRTRSPYLCPLETRWPSYTPRQRVPNLVAFYDMHGLQWDYSFPRSPHGGWQLSRQPISSYKQQHTDRLRCESCHILSWPTEGVLEWVSKHSLCFELLYSSRITNVDKCSWASGPDPEFLLQFYQCCVSSVKSLSKYSPFVYRKLSMLRVKTCLVAGKLPSLYNYLYTQRLSDFTAWSISVFLFYIITCLNLDKFSSIPIRDVHWRVHFRDSRIYCNIERCLSNSSRENIA
jgi:hypothetical protein